MAISVANSSTTRFGTITWFKIAVIIFTCERCVVCGIFFLIIAVTLLFSKSLAEIPVFNTPAKTTLDLSNTEFNSLSLTFNKYSIVCLLNSFSSNKKLNSLDFTASVAFLLLILITDFCRVINEDVIKSSSACVKIGSTDCATSFLCNSVFLVSITLMSF